MKPPPAHRVHSLSGVLDPLVVVRASSLHSRVVVRASSLHSHVVLRASSLHSHVVLRASSLRIRSKCHLMACLLLLSLAWLPAALGLDVLWHDSFEGFNLQLRWEITAGVWEMGSPTSGPGAPPPGGGTNVAATVLNGNYPEGVDTRLIRRQSFRVPEVNPRLRFRHWFNFNWDDNGQVQVREGEGEWETLAVYPQALASCGRWERASLDLSKYAGKDIQLAFLFHSQINSNGYSYVAEGWYVDDVEIVSGPMEFRNPENFEASDFWDHWYTDNGVWEGGGSHRGTGGAA
ncbi:MAG: immune inhibitor A [Verrucomicrobia bacterium]|nr:immune inhibitor A [Verrucomicrobiota bacterium]